MGRSKKTPEAGPGSALPPSTGHLRLARQLFDLDADRDRFIQALTRPEAAAPALAWLQDRPSTPPFAVLPPATWQPGFVDRIAPGSGAGRHELHAAGAYYCLDLSSVFAASPLLDLPRKPAAVLDLCAAPGGKSVLSYLSLHPQRLVANEVIGKRTAALIANLRRCGLDQVEVTRQDSAALATQYPEAFNGVLVDAPCSGQSLRVKGRPVPGGFHPATVNLNANRQRRILGNAARMVASGGWLLYATCTFAKKENESNAAWFLKRHPDFQAAPVPRLEDHRSHLADFPAYRLWPMDNLGAGAFTVLFHRPAQP